MAEKHDEPHGRPAHANRELAKNIGRFAVVKGAVRHDFAARGLE
jgi:hypothetical protein